MVADSTERSIRFHTAFEPGTRGGRDRPEALLDQITQHRLCEHFYWSDVLEKCHLIQKNKDIALNAIVQTATLKLLTLLTYNNLNYVSIDIY